MNSRDQIPESERGAGGAAGFVVFVLCIALIAFVAGSVVVFTKVWPYRLLADAHEAAVALYLKETQYSDRYKTDQWAEARSVGEGVTVNKPAKALKGYTLYSSTYEPAAYLIDMKGNVVHQWKADVDKIWRNSKDPAKEPPLGNSVYMRKTWMYPNGDLLVVYEGAGDTPWGLGLVKLDKDSNVIWSYTKEMAHHDVEVGTGGTVFQLTHTMRHDPIEGLGNLEPPFIEDFLVTHSPDGKVTDRISLLKLVGQSRFKWQIFSLNEASTKDPLHTNSVKEIGKEAAAHMPFAKAGDLLINFRNLRLIVVYDPQTKKIVWGTTGAWAGEHDAEPLANGHIMIFDNVGNYRGMRGASRVVEFDPMTMGEVWSWQGTKDDKLFSELRAAAQRLENGNTLITEAEGGRLIEVTPAGKVAWEYVNPVRGGKGKKKIPAVVWGHRYTRDEIDPAFLSTLEPSPSKGDVK